MMSNVNDDIQWVKEITTTHIFGADIEAIWEFLIDTRKTYEAVKSIRSDAYFTKGKNSFELGSEFHFTWRKNLKFDIRVEEIFSSKNLKKVSYLMDCKLLNFKYLCVMELFNITSTDSTLIKYSFIYEGEKGIQMNQLQLNKTYDERTEMIRKFHDYIVFFKKDKVIKFSQTESITLKVQARHLWKIFSDIRKIKMILPNYCKNFELIKDGQNNKFKIEWKDIGLILAEVEKIECDDLNERYSQGIKCTKIDERQDSENQNICLEKNYYQILFKIVKFDNTHSFFEITHNFYSQLPIEYKNLLSAHKVEVLNKLRKKFDSVKK